MIEIVRRLVCCFSGRRSSTACNFHLMPPMHTHWCKVIITITIILFDFQYSRTMSSYLRNKLEKGNGNSIFPVFWAYVHVFHVQRFTLPRRITEVINSVSHNFLQFVGFSYESFVKPTASKSVHFQSWKIGCNNGKIMKFLKSAKLRLQGACLWH